jgi:DNA-directed RNA polymerase I subunit RPA2
VPSTLEIVLVRTKNVPAQYPGLFLFTGPARMMRPVMNLSAGRVELIGSFEQVFMDICLRREEVYPGVTTHQELSETAFLSNLACLIPMPDCNQSPRNMYQCQMGKQTMGTCCHTWNIQAETKLYRLQTPSSPLFRPVHYDNINLDDFAMGTNAIVAVISYTVSTQCSTVIQTSSVVVNNVLLSPQGYDMEDAMIINKSSYDRGFAHGSVLKSEFFDLKGVESRFERDPNKPELEGVLDSEGLPYVG